MTLLEPTVPADYQSSHAVAIRELCRLCVAAIEGEGLHAETLVDLARFCTAQEITDALVEGAYQSDEGERSGLPGCDWRMADCRQLVPEVIRARLTLHVLAPHFDGAGRAAIDAEVATLDGIMEGLGAALACVSWAFWESIAAADVLLDAGSSWWADAYHAARASRQSDRADRN